MNKPRNSLSIRTSNLLVHGKYRSVPGSGTNSPAVFPLLSENPVIARFLGLLRIIVPASRPKARLAGTPENAFGAALRVEDVVFEHVGLSTSGSAKIVSTVMASHLYY